MTEHPYRESIPLPVVTRATSPEEIRALADSMKDKIENASLIAVTNKRTGQMEGLYGRALLAAVDQGVMPAQDYRYLEFVCDLDPPSICLELILACVKTVKGSHDFELPS